MTVHEQLERKNEMLKRRINHMLMKQNQNGLGRQDANFLKQSIRELHEINYTLKHS